MIVFCCTLRNGQMVLWQPFPLLCWTAVSGKLLGISQCGWVMRGELRNIRENDQIRCCIRMNVLSFLCTQIPWELKISINYASLCVMINYASCLWWKSTIWKILTWYLRSIQGNELSSYLYVDISAILLFLWSLHGWIGVWMFCWKKNDWIHL